MASHNSTATAKGMVFRKEHLPGSTLPWWKNRPAYKPIYLLAIFSIFIFLNVIPPPQSMINIMTQVSPTGYVLPKDTSNIHEAVNKKLHPEAYDKWKAGEQVAQGELMSPEQCANLAMAMLTILLFAAFCWGTETLPLGATDILIAVFMYLFCVMPWNDIARAYMKDAVFFIFGILAIAAGISRTGLDRRIGLLMLGKIRGAKSFCFIFLPIMSITCGFFSEHAMVALLTPVFMGVYRASREINGVKKDRAMAIFLLLGLCFACNVGGPGSPAAGGRNAVMIGYMAERGAHIGFNQWIMYGMPLVPVLSIVIGLFLYLVLRPKFAGKGYLNPAEVVKEEVKKLPKFGGKEAWMLAILIGMILGWIFFEYKFGLGGITLFAVGAMFLTRCVDWDMLQNDIPLDVVGLYAAACAMGKGLAFTGGALWLAQTIVGVLPDFMSQGAGITLGVSFLTSALTNAMSDGATVAALGPIVLPMAPMAGVHMWKVGLACAFSSSFAHCLVVGTPNNAIAYGLGKDPDTGERVLDVMDYIKYGIPIWFLSLAVLWLWCIFGYWNFMPWPGV